MTSRFRLRAGKGGAAALPPPPPNFHGGTPRSLTPRTQITPRDTGKGAMSSVEQRLRSKGTLTVHITSYTPGKKGTAPFDSYVRVSINNHEERTSVSRKTAEPHWAERLQFHGTLHQYAVSTIGVSLWESHDRGGRLTRDHRKSHATIPMSGVLECAAARP